MTPRQSGDAFATLCCDIHVKHTRRTQFQPTGSLPASTIVDINIVLEPHSDNALIDAIYDVTKLGPQCTHIIQKDQVAGSNTMVKRSLRFQALSVVAC